MRVLLIAAAFITSLVSARQMSITGFTDNYDCKQNGAEGGSWYTWTIDSSDPASCFSFDWDGEQLPMQSIAYLLPGGRSQQPFAEFFYTTGTTAGQGAWECVIENFETVITTDYINKRSQNLPDGGYWMCISPKSSDGWTSALIT
jgi:hypothetical protein